MKRIVRRILLSPWFIIPLIIFLIGLALYIKMPGFKGFFTPNRLEMEPTTTLITQINKIAKLLSITYYDETIVVREKKEPTVKKAISKAILSGGALMPGYGNSILEQMEQVIIVKARVISGFDLSQSDTSDIYTNGKQIRFELPPPQIIEVISNPQDLEVFYETGNWSVDETLEGHKLGIEKIKQTALENGILEKSEDSAIIVLTNFFLLLGYEEIVITVRTNGVGVPPS